MDTLAPLGLDTDKAGVSDFARRLLVGDPRGRVDREFTLDGKEPFTVTAGILDVWRTYADDPRYHALWVMYKGERRLIHRKYPVGFTPFAKENMLFPTGHAMDHKRRNYVLGGRTEDKRVRREMRATLLVVWLTYAAEPDLDHLWVQWSDGKRRLVHRKGL